MAGGAPQRALEITNTQDFLGTDHLSVRWELRRRGKRIASGSLDGVMPSLPPHASWRLLPVVAPWKDSVAAAFGRRLPGPIVLHLITIRPEPTAWSAANAQLGTHSFELQPPSNSPCALATTRPEWRPSPPHGGGSPPPHYHYAFPMGAVERSPPALSLVLWRFGVGGKRRRLRSLRRPVWHPVHAMQEEEAFDHDASDKEGTAFGGGYGGYGGYDGGGRGMLILAMILS